MQYVHRSGEKTSKASMLGKSSHKSPGHHCYWLLINQSSSGCYKTQITDYRLSYMDYELLKTGTVIEHGMTNKLAPYQNIPVLKLMTASHQFLDSMHLLYTY